MVSPLQLESEPSLASTQPLIYDVLSLSHACLLRSQIDSVYGDQFGSPDQNGVLYMVTRGGSEGLLGVSEGL